MKPGYKTTEFWVAIIIAVSTFVASLADALGPKYAALSSSIVGAGYAVARGLAKVFPPKPSG